eukprot:2789491-Rhodomonas_salina.1
MSGMDIPYADVCLRACYAISGMDIAHGRISLRACYSLPSTHTRQSPTRALTEQKKTPLSEPPHPTPFPFFSIFPPTLGEAGRGDGKELCG